MCRIPYTVDDARKIHIYIQKHTHNQRDAYTVCKTLKTMNEIINNIKQINIQKNINNHKKKENNTKCKINNKKLKVIKNEKQKITIIMLNA